MTVRTKTSMSPGYMMEASSSENDQSVMITRSSYEKGAYLILSHILLPDSIFSC